MLKVYSWIVGILILTYVLMSFAGAMMIKQETIKKAIINMNLVR